MRDARRADVYAAEDMVARMFERGGTVRMHGAELSLPPEARFGDVAGVQRYVDEVLASRAVEAAFPKARRPVRVRRRAGATRAHYEAARAGEPAVIALPAGWAMRELVVLHELAHHLDPAPDPPHGPSFVVTFAELAGVVMGPEVQFVLRTTLP